MFVARDVAGRVDHVNAARFAFPAACLVETLLMRTCELGGVGQTGHGGRCHSSRNSRYNWRLPFDHLEDLLRCFLAGFIFEALPGQLRKSLLELAVRDGAGGLVPAKCCGKYRVTKLTVFIHTDAQDRNTSTCI